MTGEATRGIQLVEEDDSKSLAGRCPVCHEPVREPVTSCSLCHTSHHEDCWTYNGGCATYGCRNTGVEKGVGDNQCPVCFQTLSGALIRCRYCRSRHHNPCYLENRGCGVMGCKGNTVTALQEGLPDKIALPRLRVAAFLGVFHVTPATISWVIGMELAFLGLISWGLSFWLCVPFLLAMVAGLVWAGISAEQYNFDLKNACITKSKLVLDREVWELPVMLFEDVVTLDWERVIGGERLVARVRTPRPHLQSVELTPCLEPGSEDRGQVEAMVDRLSAFNVISVRPRLTGSLTGSE